MEFDESEELHHFRRSKFDLFQIVARVDVSINRRLGIMKHAALF